MFHTARVGRVIALASLAVLALLGTAAFAAAPAPTIGVVDFPVIMKGYVGLQMASSQYQALIQEANRPLTELEKGLGLSEADFTTYRKLVGQTAKDKDAIAKLEAQAKANRDEYDQINAAMRNGDKLTDAQQARLNELNNLIEPVYNQLRELSQAAEQKIEAQGKLLQDTLMTLVNDGIAKVAKDQKLSLVLNKSLQIGQGNSEKVVIWNDEKLDITDKVLKVLNDSFKPDMLAPKATTTNGTTGATIEKK